MDVDGSDVERALSNAACSSSSTTGQTVSFPTKVVIKPHLSDPLAAVTLKQLDPRHAATRHQRHPLVNEGTEVVNQNHGGVSLLPSPS